MFPRKHFELPTFQDEMYAEKRKFILTLNFSNLIAIPFFGSATFEEQHKMFNLYNSVFSLKACNLRLC